jgi:translation initiation factor 4A
MTDLSMYLKVTTHACVGGTAVREDIEKLKQGIQMVVGTPGRVNDMIERSALRLDKLKLFVLDEADEMLSRGFKDQIYDCFQSVPGDVQVGLFSATMPLDILQLTDKFLRSPVRILVKKKRIDIRWY